MESVSRSYFAGVQEVSVVVGGVEGLKGVLRVI